MARGRQVTIQFIGDARSLVSATNSAGKATNGLGSKLKTLGKTAGLAAGVATVALAKGLWEVTEAAVADQAAAKSLALQLKNTTGATNDQIASVEKWITAQGKALGVTDDELRPALSKLATATHDVTKAQDLLAVAMDVSAGTGKSLDAVTSALQKGVNGSVGGLARLGVKTKDAAGETKSFNAIVADLSKNFQGQAAKSADTAAGRFQRLKVELSEMGENLGYKVLPYVNEFGEWMLNEGVPAAERLAKWLGKELSPALDDLAGFARENADEFKDFGETTLDTVIPALRTAGKVTGDLVGLIDDLPGPVKEFGVQALIASRLVGGLNTSLVNTRTTMQGWTTAADASTKRMEALGKAARTAGGVGGMLLLADGVQRTESNLGLLESAAGGALAGSAAGPWGALIGGVLGGAMGLLARQTDKAATSAADAATKWQDYASALDQTTGALTAQGKAQAYNNLQSSGALKAANDLGVTSKTVLNAVLGQAGARGKLTDAIAAEEKALDALNKKAEHATVDPQTSKKELDAMWAEIKARQENIDLLKAEVSAGEQSRKETAKRIQTLKGVPPKVTSYFSVNGIPESLAGMAKVIAKFDVTDKRKIRAILGVDGAEVTAGKVQRVIDKMNEIRRNPRVDTYITTHINTVKGHDISNGSGRISAGMGGTSAADFRDQMRGFFQSAFSADLTDPTTGAGPTIDSMLAYQQGELAKAQKLKADIASLVSKGVSKDVLDQLAAAGPSGMAQISALASGSSAQIAQFSALSAQTMGALTGIPGANGGAATNGMNQQTELLKKMVAQGDAKLEMRLTSDTVVWLIRKHERKTGVKLLAN